MLKPYSLELSIALEDANSTAFEFVTDRGSTYYLYFRDVSKTFNNAPVYDFGFFCLNDPNSGNSKKKDERISHTICKALDDFLFANKNIVIYVPLDDERSHSSRIKVFDGWYSEFKTYFNCQKLEKDRITLSYGKDNFIVTLFYNPEQREIAKEILYGNLQHLTNHLTL